MNRIEITVAQIETLSPLDGAERIRQLREGQGLSQVEIARKLGVTGACVSNWEKGKTFPRRDLLQALASVLGTTSDYLLRGAGSHDQPRSQAADEVIIEARRRVADALGLTVDRVHILVD